jgi:hypothetical protein
MPISLFAMDTLELAFALVVFGMQVAAIWFLFQDDAKAWFKPGGRSADPGIFD